MAATVPKHACRWYPISTALEDWNPAFKTRGRPGVTKPRGWPGPVKAGQPVLYACGVEKRCTRHLDAVGMFRLMRSEGPHILMQGLPSWYPRWEREAVLRAGLPAEVDYTDQGCSVCGKVFGTRDAGMRHLARHAGP